MTSSSSGRHLLKLLNEILDLSKVEAGRMELEPSIFSIRAALEYGISMVRERASLHGIAVTLELDPTMDWINSDELRVKQVLLEPAEQRGEVHPRWRARRRRGPAA